MKLEPVERIIVLCVVGCLLLLGAVVTVELSLMRRSVLVEEAQLGLNALALAAQTEGCTNVVIEDDVWLQARVR
jgi:hypothetical protein